MWNHVTFSNLKRWAKVCGKAAGDEAEDEAEDMEAPLGKDLVDLRWDSMLTFSLTIFQGFMWATAFFQEDDK